jgi:hypothetical protein
MWLAEGGYTTSVHLLLSTSGSVRRLEVNYTWTMADTCIQHRLAALVQVTLGENSQRVVGGAPGSRSAQRLRQL